MIPAKEVDETLWAASGQFDQLMCSCSELSDIIDHEVKYYSMLRRRIGSNPNAMRHLSIKVDAGTYYNR